MLAKAKISIPEQEKQILHFDDAVIAREAFRRRFRKFDDIAIIREATRRREKLRKKNGLYATNKKIKRCEGCNEKFSVREMRSHWPRCPKRVR